MSVSEPAPPRRWLAAVQVIASLAILAALVAFVDFDALAARFASADPLWMALGLLVGVAQLVVLGLRP